MQAAAVAVLAGLSQGHGTEFAPSLYAGSNCGGETYYSIEDLNMAGVCINLGDAVAGNVPDRVACTYFSHGGVDSAPCATKF